MFNSYFAITLDIDVDTIIQVRTQNSFPDDRVISSGFDDLDYFSFSSNVLTFRMSLLDLLHQHDTIAFIAVYPSSDLQAVMTDFDFDGNMTNEVVEQVGDAYLIFRNNDHRFSYLSGTLSTVDYSSGSIPPPVEPPPPTTIEVDFTSLIAHIDSKFSSLEGVLNSLSGGTNSLLSLVFDKLDVLQSSLSSFSSSLSSEVENISLLNDQALELKSTIAEVKDTFDAVGSAYFASLNLKIESLNIDTMRSL